MRIINIKDRIDLIQDVISLGDKHSKTLGFFPKEAFEVQALKGLIFCAVEDNNLLGYLMYRISYDRINIVHLCVDEKYRKRHVAIKMIDKLKSISTKYRGLRLKCRNDYEANTFWEKAHFSPISEMQGRSKKGHLLTVWWYENPQNNLFSNLSNPEVNQRIILAIDTNIFLDLRLEREEESLALTNNWLDEEIEICVTKEIFNELNRNPSRSVRNECRNFVQNFRLLEFDENKFELIYYEIKSKFKQHTKRYKSDLRQIIDAIIGGAEYFLTRDAYWITQSTFFEEKYNLAILGPATFITELDEKKESSKYQPKKLAGTDIMSEVLNSKRIREIVDAFYYNSQKSQEKKSSFQRQLNSYLANPKENEIYTIIDQSRTTLAFLAINFSETSTLKVPFFRVTTNNLRKTLIQQLIYKIVEQAEKRQSNIITIQDSFLSLETIEILNESSFILIGKVWVKVNISGVHSLKEIEKTLLNLKMDASVEADQVIDKLLPIVKDLIISYNHSNCYQLEKLLYPVKIVELDIPCFVIPIKIEWATQLFEERLLSERLNLFEKKKHLILNRKNVYYRSSRPNRLEAPSRILWYSSSTKKEQGFISASSYIEHIEINIPQQLFKKYKNLGIYEWNDIMKLAHGEINRTIMAFLFSGTVLLKHRISLKKIKKLYSFQENKEFNPISPIKISKELYLNLYKTGF